MGAQKLMEAEEKFGAHLADLIEKMSTIQEEARNVVAAGGDCRRAFLAVVPEEDRPAVEAQWPYIALMLGV